MDRKYRGNAQLETTVKLFGDKQENIDSILNGLRLHGYER